MRASASLVFRSLLWFQLCSSHLSFSGVIYMVLKFLKDANNGGFRLSLKCAIFDVFDNT